MNTRDIVDNLKRAHNECSYYRDMSSDLYMIDIYRSKVTVYFRNRTGFLELMSMSVLTMSFEEVKAVLDSFFNFNENTNHDRPEREN